MTQRGKCVPKTVLSFNIYLFLYELEAPDLKIIHKKCAEGKSKDNIALVSGPRKRH